jgi:hypothetical protein
MWRQDPGPCPICGKAHTACKPARPTAIELTVLPARDARVGNVPTPADVEPPELVAEVVQATLPKDTFTTGTYRRKKDR